MLKYVEFKIFKILLLTSNYLDNMFWYFINNLNIFSISGNTYDEYYLYKEQKSPFESQDCKVSSEMFVRRNKFPHFIYN